MNDREPCFPAPGIRRNVAQFLGARVETPQESLVKHRVVPFRRNRHMGKAAGGPLRPIGRGRSPQVPPARKAARR